ncbi:hypothetical protein [Prauserella alba]|nr:hypothetical protein [Prauserella alba]
MGTIGRRMVDGEHKLAITVEHHFSLAETVEAVMVLKPALRPGNGRHVRPLQTSEVRQALHHAARHRTGRPHPVLLAYEDEPAGGELHQLADWIRRELVRLGLFTGSGHPHDTWPEPTTTNDSTRGKG